MKFIDTIRNKDIYKRGRLPFAINFCQSRNGFR
jgi:hypothetical protein